jgi:glycosyltransferase involved in cell wall biosynthesis
VLALRDPLRNRRGDATFTRAHLHAAVGAGISPWVLFPGVEAGIERTSLGTFESVPCALIRCAAPLRPAASILAASSTRRLGEAVAARASADDGPIVIHAMGVTAHAAVVGARDLMTRGRTASAIASCYTSLEHEYAAKVTAVRRWHTTGQWLRALLEFWWVRRSVARDEAAGYQGARLVLVNYRSVDREIRSRWPSTLTRLVPYSSEQAFFDDGPLRRHGGRAGPPTIATLAWHDPRKGWETLLTALAWLRERGEPFAARLLGGGPLLEAHRRLAARLGLDGAVRIEGETEQPFAALREADVFVLASRQEGSGSLAVLEALQAGLPVIASGVDGLMEDVQDGVNGLLFPPSDAGALAATLGALLADEPRRRRLALGARRSFEQRYAAAPFVDALGVVYRELGLIPED